MYVSVYIYIYIYIFTQQILLIQLFVCLICHHPFLSRKRNYNFIFLVSAKKEVFHLLHINKYFNEFFLLYLNAFSVLSVIVARQQESVPK